MQQSFILVCWAGVTAGPFTVLVICRSPPFSSNGRGGIGGGHSHIMIHVHVVLSLIIYYVYIKVSSKLSRDSSESDFSIYPDT